MIRALRKRCIFNSFFFISGSARFGWQVRNEKHPKIAPKWDIIKATQEHLYKSVSSHNGWNGAFSNQDSHAMCIELYGIFVVFVLRKMLFLPRSQSDFIQWANEHGQIYCMLYNFSNIMGALSLNFWQTWCHNTKNNIPTTKRVFQMELTQHKIHLMKVEWAKSFVFALNTKHTLTNSIQIFRCIKQKSQHYPN